MEVPAEVVDTSLIHPRSPNWRESLNTWSNTSLSLSHLRNRLVWGPLIRNTWSFKGDYEYFDKGISGHFKPVIAITFVNRGSSSTRVLSSTHHRRGVWIAKPHSHWATFTAKSTTHSRTNYLWTDLPTFGEDLIWSINCVLICALGFVGQACWNSFQSFTIFRH